MKITNSENFIILKILIQTNALGRGADTSQ